MNTLVAMTSLIRLDFNQYFSKFGFLSNNSPKQFLPSRHHASFLENLKLEGPGNMMHFGTR